MVDRSSGGLIAVVDRSSGRWFKQWWMEGVVDGSSGGWKEW